MTRLVITRDVVRKIEIGTGVIIFESTVDGKLRLCTDGDYTFLNKAEAHEFLEALTVMIERL